VWIELYCDAGSIRALGRVPLQVYSRNGPVHFARALFPIRVPLMEGVAIWAALFNEERDRVPVRAELLVQSNPALRPGDTLTVNIVMTVNRPEF
jgi:hypothetical protein